MLTDKIQQETACWMMKKKIYITIFRSEQELKAISIPIIYYLNFHHWGDWNVKGSTELHDLKIYS